MIPFDCSVQVAPSANLEAFFQELTVEARDRPAMISLRLLIVLNVQFKYAPLFRKLGAERRTACPDGRPRPPRLATS